MITSWLPYCAILFASSLLVSLLLSSLGLVSTLGHDRNEGIQKFHAHPTSRLGGISIVAGLAVAVYATAPINSEVSSWIVWLLLASVPVFAGGLVEDLTHKVGPNARLLLAIVSASLAYYYLHIGVQRVDVAPIDALLSLPAATYLVTLLVVSGFVQSVNIIDGFHGLASGVLVIMLSALMAMAWRCGDTLFLLLCLTTLSVTLGLFVLNWPLGKIFLGDAGAYLLGFWVVELGLLLLSRNPTLSPIAPIMVGILPLIETLFSMYRRKFVRQHPINHPDSLHLHTLIYRRLVSHPQDRTKQHKNDANARVAVYLWVPSFAFAAVTCLLMDQTDALLLLMLIFIAAYIWLYRCLVKFKAPAWLNRRARTSAGLESVYAPLQHQPTKPTETR